jgi:hypothetical protein
LGHPPCRELQPHVTALFGNLGATITRSTSCDAVLPLPLSEPASRDLKAICLLSNPSFRTYSAVLEPLLQLTVTPAFRRRQDTNSKKTR